MPVDQDKTSILLNGEHDKSVSLEDLLDVSSEYSEDQDKKPNTRHSNLMRFKMEHPLSDSHGVRYIMNNTSCVPNFVGANLPRCDQGDWEYKNIPSQRKRDSICVTSMFDMSALMQEMTIELK